MTTRANYFGLSPEGMNILINQESYLAEQFTEQSLITPHTITLVKLRVSQINQCAYCIDMHTGEAMKKNEQTKKVTGLSAWRDMPYYDENERVALTWAEKLTYGKQVDDDFYQQTVSVIGEGMLVKLTLAVNAINSWNRIAKAFKTEVGSYRN